MPEYSFIVDTMSNNNILHSLESIKAKLRQFQISQTNNPSPSLIVNSNTPPNDLSLPYVHSTDKLKENSGNTNSMRTFTSPDTEIQNMNLKPPVFLHSNFVTSTPYTDNFAAKVKHNAHSYNVPQTTLETCMQTQKSFLMSEYRGAQSLSHKGIVSDVPLDYEYLSPCESSLTQNTATSTFEVEDHKARMKNIEMGGNSPEEWQSYIDFLKVVPSENDLRSKPLSEAYNKAFYGILNTREHKNSDSFARLIMDYVLYKSDRLEWDFVDNILDMARAKVQIFAVIIIASAEVKLLQGDHEKALSILNKAVMAGRAQPKELLIRAINSIEAGQTKLLTDQERKLQDPWILGKNGSQEDDFKMPLSSKSLHSHTESNLEMGLGSLFAENSEVSNNFGTIELSRSADPTSATKHSMRHYSSTPEFRANLCVPSSLLRNSKLKVKGNLGQPMRVLRPLQQHAVKMLSEAEEDDTNLANSVQPLPPFTNTSGIISSQSCTFSYENNKTLLTEENHDHPHLHQKSVSKNTNEYSQVNCKNAQRKEIIEEKILDQKRHEPVLFTPCKDQHLQCNSLKTPSEGFETVDVNGEQYCIIRKVGRGGSAKVYMVLDSKKNVRALKVVDLEGIGPEGVDGYQNEIALLKRLQYCDSVIKMYNLVPLGDIHCLKDEYNENQNRLYVVLEYGETDLSGFFSSRAKHKGNGDLTIKFYWREMLRAVNALHREGIIHSDLKPANFMLVAGNVKLIDFGIANALQQDKTSLLRDARTGTPSYMSPEAIMAAYDDGGDDSGEDKENMNKKAKPKYKISVRSDVWSLGCILYSMVYGYTPFQHIKNNLCKLQAITNPNFEIKFPPVSDTNLLDVLQKCLKRDMRSRPTTDELLQHSYLNSCDKEYANNTSIKEKTTPDPCATAPSGKLTDSLKVKEFLHEHLVQGSPRTKAVMSELLLQLENNKKMGADPVCPESKLTSQASK